MAPPSGTWIAPTFSFGQLNDEVTKAMYSSPIRPRQIKTSRTRQDTSSDSDCPLMNGYVARRSEKPAGKKRSRQEMEQDTRVAPTQPDLEHAVQRERFSFSIPASKKAHEMSAKSGDIFGPLLCEMILELIRQKAWSLDTLQDQTVSVQNQQPTTSPKGIPLRTSPSSSAKSFEMTPEERIQEIVDDTRFRKTKVIGLYGQGKLEIGGQKANCTMMDGVKRCDVCVKFKRGSSVAVPALSYRRWSTNSYHVTDCFRVEPDQFFRTSACATCCEKGHRCSFLVEGNMANK